MSVQENFSSSRELEIIEYPGVVRDMDKMLHTLGGITSVSQTLGGKQKVLELRFHPDNPFNKVAYGDSSPRAGLLLSIKVRRSKRHPDRTPECKVKILGYCKRIFTFESLCDFQYLPLYTDNEATESGEKAPLKNALVSIVPQSATDTKYFNCTDIPLLCLPQTFARTDTVHTGILRNDIQEDGQQDVLGVLQKSSYDNRDIVPFNMVDNFPTRPDPQVLKRMKVKYVTDEQLECVKKLFEDCPIWTRIALLYESGLTNDKLKCIIPCLAFYFSSGPWRTLFVRYGYDPRKDFNSRYYQTFDFRLRFRSGVAEFVSKRKVTIKKRQENPYEINELVQDIDYPYFEENKLPRSRQCIMRYCDVRMSKIQEMLDKIPSPLTGVTCNERTGWLPVGFDGDVRQIVSSVIMELLRSHYRKEQIHEEFDSVEPAEEGCGEDDEDSDEEASDVNDFLAESLDDILDDSQIDEEVTN